MSAASTAASSQPQASNPFVSALDRAIARLSLLKATAPNPIRIFPGPSDFLEVARAIREAGDIFNDYVREIGDEVENNSHHVDSRAFDNVAADGVAEAAYACEAIAERLQDEREAA